MTSVDEWSGEALRAKSTECLKKKVQTIFKDLYSEFTAFLAFMVWITGYLILS
jgi:hypothetical protein